MKTKSRLVLVRMDEAQHASLQYRAKRANFKTLSAYIRAELFNAKGRIDPAVLTQLAHLRGQMAVLSPVHAHALDRIIEDLQ